MSKGVFLLIVVTIFTGNSSCKKYDNDENFMHFERVKKRLCQNWQLYSWQGVDGVERFNSAFPSEYNYSVRFSEFESRELKRLNKDWDGNFQSTFHTNVILRWVLLDKKNVLKSETLYESKIVKLTDTEFWLADGQDPVNALNFKLLKYRKQ
ncbi:MAG: hypothetical protein MUC87_12080 [Bacteroidia bacterium]|jgi:hypothetical protein|nr:hypothetical protein [Bacteroidia bacterium]